MSKDEIYATLGAAYFSDTPHEAQIVDHLPLLFRSTDRQLAVDIGASLGQYTRAFSRLLRDSTVIGIEADPVRFEELERNAAAWTAASSNSVEARHFALSDHEGEITFHTTNSNVSGAIDPEELPEGVTSEPITVPTTTLDRVLAGRKPAFVKIDVEGAELAVLRGAGEMLEAGSATLLVEVHDDDSQEVASYLETYGYRRVNFYGRDAFVKNTRLWLQLKARAARLRLQR